MTPLLEQFFSEARDFLQSIGEKLMLLESDPGSDDLMNELFRLVHTLKGNSGLFDFPEMTRVLHAGEDLLDAVRNGHVKYSQALADRLLDAMDFVSLLTDEIERSGAIGVQHAGTAVCVAESLRQLLGAAAMPVTGTVLTGGRDTTPLNNDVGQLLHAVPESVRMHLYRSAVEGLPLTLLEYTPEEECFFKGEDPFYLCRQIPDVAWASIRAQQPWPPLAELDAYRCRLVFSVLSTGEPSSLQLLFRYVPEQVSIQPVLPMALVIPQGDVSETPVSQGFVSEALAMLDNADHEGVAQSAKTLLETLAPAAWGASVLRWLLLMLELNSDNRDALRMLVDSLSSQTLPSGGIVSRQEKLAATATGLEKLSDDAARSFHVIVEAQREVLSLPNGDPWFAGRIKAVVATLAAAHRAIGKDAALQELNAAAMTALDAGQAAPLLAWLDGCLPTSSETAGGGDAARVAASPPSVSVAEGESEIKFGRRSDDTNPGSKTLKVEQTKIDRLMNLIGEMVVAKNSLPYLAGRAEDQYGVRELSREIKAQYAVINRIAEEMQDAIMQVRMMPVSFIFQRFPRLVRDISRKLGKEVHLVLEGEETEADKNIVEALADPLIHIIRNSLDHGIETPDVRRAAGKPETGRLTIRANQESDRVLIEIADDGKGIDPDLVKRKAYEKGLIDESVLDRLTDQEAVNLIFAAGFSTTEVVSDLSGRGVGMDVVRNAVEKVNGTVSINSEVGKGTRMRLSLPLSMAVTNVMVVESDGQIFGVPMDVVVETVRVPHSAIMTIKHSQATVLRERIVPLLSLNHLLALGSEPRVNEEGELATLVVRVQGEHLGIIVDDFREAVDIILKPMAGILGGLAGYAGSALLGNGSVLMVLNPRELV